MKLTNRTTPQVRNYQCDKCKSIFTHKQMYDDEYCDNCFDDLLAKGEKDGRD